MFDIRERMPLFARNEGEWRCHYRHVDPAGVLLDEHSVEIACTFPGTPESAYRQVTTNIWPDGRTESFSFDAQFDAAKERIVWDNGRIHGELWEVDDMTIYLRFGFHDDPDVDICEMIQLSSCGRHRTRVWHWFRCEELFKRTIVTEARVT